VSRRARLVFFAVAAAALAATLGIGLAGLPSFGAQVSAYARMLNELAPQQRHVTDVVSAIGFDYRGIDTLFEEFILLSAVAGISVLLRPLSDETRRLPQDKAPDRTIPPQERGPGLIFAPVPEGKTLKNRLHIDLAPGPDDDQAAEVRRLISLTGQFAALDPHLTARENLVLMARLRGRGRSGRRHHRRRRRR